MNRVQRLVNRLRERPRDERELFGITLATVGTLAVVTVWAIFIFPNIFGAKTEHEGALKTLLASGGKIKTIVQEQMAFVSSVTDETKKIFSEKNNNDETSEDGAAVVGGADNSTQKESPEESLVNAADFTENSTTSSSQAVIIVETTIGRSKTNASTSDIATGTVSKEEPISATSSENQ